MKMVPVLQQVKSKRVLPDVTLQELGLPVAALLDPFDSDQPFDLTSRCGSQAFAAASATLDETWDDTIQTFPSFLISLRARASEVKWDAPPPCRILRNNINDINYHLFTEHHSIPEDHLEQARLLHLHDRA